MRGDRGAAPSARLATLRSRGIVRERLGVSPAVRPPRDGSKLDRVLAMLSATSGATIAELMAATRWLPS